MAISDEKYLALTTYRKNGEGKSTAIWIADLGDGTIGFTTASSSWKVKRLRNDPRVTLQPSNGKGEATTDGTRATGTAILVSGPAFEAVRAKVKAKYGFQYTMINLFGKAAKLFGKGSGTDTGVVITLD